MRRKDRIVPHNLKICTRTWLLLIFVKTQLQYAFGFFPALSRRAFESSHFIDILMLNSSRFLIVLVF